MSARQWAMYAQHRPDLLEKTGREFLTFGNERYVRMHGGRYDIVEVVLTEDDEGDYYGWIAAGRDTPTMIQPGSIYRVQFPYGPEAEEERGKGETVRLRVDPADDRTEVCGETYDHDLMLIGSADGISSYECRTCGAEVVDDEDADG